MFIRIGFDLVYNVPASNPMLLMLSTHPQRTADLRRPERIVIEPWTVQTIFNDCFGNCVSRITAPPGKLRLWYDNVIEDSGRPEPTIQGARLHPIEELPLDSLQFLLASRYCEVDRLSQMAWDLFGKTPATWERVQAVMDWTHQYVTFGYEYASPRKSATDVIAEKRGVCRDFQHVAITMLRALNIPARYATGYLGDIGVPPNPAPMDFSAWLEAYLGNRWYTLDARHNKPRIGRVLMATGRDATDVALSTSFGPVTMETFLVWTDEVGPESIDQPESPPKSLKVTIMPATTSPRELTPSAR